jgi:hypothetical protein
MAIIIYFFNKVLRSLRSLTFRLASMHRFTVKPMHSKSKKWLRFILKRSYISDLTRIKGIG